MMMNATNASPTVQQQFGFRPPNFRYFKASAGMNSRPMEDMIMMQDGPGRRLRKNVANVRRHIDYIPNVLNHLQGRLWQHSRKDRVVVPPDMLYSNYLLPPASTPDVPVDCVMTKLVRSAINKIKSQVYAIQWTPEGKRLTTGASSGEFTLWNGSAFNFETILQAHDVAVRAIKWSHNDQWMVSADQDGFVKYWQPNMNNVHMFQAHKDEPIRSISFAPTDVKFVTGSDDGTARVWDFATCQEERVLRGHGADVRSVNWHPLKGLVATGSRDSQQPVKLWDPKSGQCLATLYDHKNSVMAVQWNQNGNWLLTGARDHLIKLYDIRMMKEVQTFRGHKKEVTSLSWHPVHEGLFVSGGGDGSLGYWLVNTDKELALLEQAHDQTIWCVEWHPLGHILATGSNDYSTKFWARNRPGDTQEDIFGLAPVTGNRQSLTAIASAAADQKRIKMEEETVQEKPKVPVIPGMGLDDDIYQEMNRDVPTIIPSLPGSTPLTATQIPGLSVGATISTGANALPFEMARQRQPLLKQPPPKKAQRQFERTWMVSKPTGGGGDDEEGGFSFNDGTEQGARNMRGQHQQTKLSLLGPPPMPGTSAMHFPPPPTMSMLGPNQGAPPPQIGDSWRTVPNIPPQPLPPNAPLPMPPRLGFNNSGNGWARPPFSGVDPQQMQPRFNSGGQFFPNAPPPPPNATNMRGGSRGRGNYERGRW